jgi:peptidoglycan/LPS O-acetylase OafA/YrhL
MSSHTATSPAFRTDIQVLRGVAVSLVLLFHAKLGGNSSSFLGVDVFFVISGFLITSHLASATAAGQFSLRRFWLRRMQRLLPAAYCTYALTWALAQYLVTPPELLQLGKQVAGALAFVSNVVLWKQSGYFFGAAEFKPLLHTWSLSIEGQYYLLAPLLCLWLPRRHWLKAMLALATLSLLLCLAFQHKDAAFYLLPFRAWELLIGAATALLVARVPAWVSGPRAHALAWVGLLLLALAPAWGRHPGLPALLVCLFTAVILLARQEAVHRNPVSRSMAWVGDFSYSLYLVHWPIMAFARHIWLPDGPAPLPVRLGLVALSLALGYAMYRAVERPFNRSLNLRPAVLATGLAVFAGGVAAAVVWRLPSPEAAMQETRAREPNRGFAEACAQHGARFEALAACQTGPDADVLVWGDSFAMHLVEGLVQARHLKVVQATQPLCGPLLGLAVVRGKPFGNVEAAQTCLDFNQSVAAWLASEAGQRIRLVVLASPFDQYVMPEEVNLLGTGAMAGQRVNASAPQALAGLQRTLAAVRAAGKQVVVVAPPPFADFDIGRCLERTEAGYPVAGVLRGCDVPLQAYHRVRQPVLQLLADIEQQGTVKVLRFDPLLCDAQRCAVRYEGALVYSDKGHLSHAGGVALMRHLPIE